MVSPRCHLFDAPRHFRICTNSFRLNHANTSLSRATSQHVIEIHARVVASAAGCVRI
jgi:hypothetical protein